jgi:hypothetical protein
MTGSHGIAIYAPTITFNNEVAAYPLIKSNETTVSNLSKVGTWGDYLFNNYFNIY